MVIACVNRIPRGAARVVLVALLLKATLSTAQQSGVPPADTEFFPSHTPEVVFLEVKDKDDASALPASGTGFVLQNGYVLTAKHVAAAFAPHSTDVSGAVGTRYGTHIPLDLVVPAPDPLDLALLKFREIPGNSKAVHVGNPYSMHVGGTYVTLSFPGEYGLTMSATQILGAAKAGRWLAAADLMPGSSGGPVYDLDGGGVVAIVMTGAPGSSEVIPINQAATLLLSAGYGVGPLASALGFGDAEIKNILASVTHNPNSDAVRTLAATKPAGAITPSPTCSNTVIEVDLTNPQNSPGRDLTYTVPADAGCKITKADYTDRSRTRASVTPIFSNTVASLKVHLDGVPIFGARSWAHGEFRVTQVPTAP